MLSSSTAEPNTAVCKNLFIVALSVVFLARGRAPVAPDALVTPAGVVGGALCLLPGGGAGAALGEAFVG
eukprot:COSAG01_NODE_9583_length_2402_cov_1.595745_1_plen_68_part_10